MSALFIAVGIVSLGGISCRFISKAVSRHADERYYLDIKTR